MLFLVLDTWKEYFKYNNGGQRDEENINIQHSINNILNLNI